MLKIQSIITKPFIFYKTQATINPGVKIRVTILGTRASELDPSKAGVKDPYNKFPQTNCFMHDIKSSKTLKKNTR